MNDVISVNRPIRAVYDFTGVVRRREEEEYGKPRHITPNIECLGYLTRTGEVDKRYLGEMIDAHNMYSRGEISHLDLRIAAHDALGKALHGKKVKDVDDAVRVFWKRKKKKPHYFIRRVLQATNLYGENMVVTGDLDTFVAAYDKAVLEPLGISFGEERIFGMRLYRDSDDPEIARFVADQLREVPYSSSPIVAMERRMDLEEEKLQVVLGVMGRQDLRNIIVFGDSSAERALFEACGYPVMFDPTPDLVEDETTRNYGLVIPNMDYMNRFMRVMDFVYTFPHRDEFDVDGYRVTLERRIENRYKGRVLINIRNKSMLQRHLKTFFTGKVKIQITPETTELDLKRFFRRKWVDDDVSQAIWEKISEYRAKSKFDELKGRGFIL